MALSLLNSYNFNNTLYSYKPLDIVKYDDAHIAVAYVTTENTSTLKVSMLEISPDGTITHVSTANITWSVAFRHIGLAKASDGYLLVAYTDADNDGRVYRCSVSEEYVVSGVNGLEYGPQDSRFAKLLDLTNNCFAVASENQAGAASSMFVYNYSFSSRGNVSFPNNAYNIDLVLVDPLRIMTVCTFPTNNVTYLRMQKAINNGYYSSFTQESELQVSNWNTESTQESYRRNTNFIKLTDSRYILTRSKYFSGAYYTTLHLITLDTNYAITVAQTLTFSGAEDIVAEKIDDDTIVVIMKNRWAVYDISGNNFTNVFYSDTVPSFDLDYWLSICKISDTQFCVAGKSGNSLKIFSLFEPVAPSIPLSFNLGGEKKQAVAMKINVGGASKNVVSIKQNTGI